MRAKLGLIVLLAACSSDKADIGDGNPDGGGGSGGSAGSAATGGSAGSTGGSAGSTGGSGGSGGTGGSAGSAGTAGSAGSGTCPPLWNESQPNCSPKYVGSFECYCDLGEIYHPIGCDTTKQELFDKWDTLTLVEYADCGLSVIYVPASLDGDQQYIFDATGKLIGVRVTSDHGPPCEAGEEVGSACIVSGCTQKSATSPPCPL